MTQILTTRLSGVVPNLIHQDQAGFIKGRRIEDQTELAKLMLNKCEADEENGVIVCLDQEKAYDKICHDFIWKSLEKYQFPEHFIKTIRALYTNAETVIIINGVISSAYHVTRGVWQGDPLSCLIFNLAIESLASMLRNSTLKGFKIKCNTDRLITTLFADDTTVYLSQQDNFADLQQILLKWCHVSGAKFNVQKTVIIPIGTPQYQELVCQSRKMSPEHPRIPDSIQIAKDGTPTRMLGAFIGNGLEEISIWTPTLEKINSQLKIWNRNHPTQDGRRLVINMEIAARTQYLTRVQGMPKEVEQTLTKTIRNFMWDDQKPMISLDTIEKPHLKGGKKVLDLLSRNEAIELMKTKAYLNLGPNRPRWAYVADSLINKNIPKSQRVSDERSKENMFLQNWSTTVRQGKTSLPQSLRRMLGVAKKYNVGIKPLLPNGALKNNMPIWHHIGSDPHKRPQNNSALARCLRNKHKILTTGELYNFAMEILPPCHNGHKNCACQPCKRIANLGCNHTVTILVSVEQKVGKLYKHYCLSGTQPCLAMMTILTLPQNKLNKMRLRYQT